ncbi:MAG: DAK2 domain-containing protein [Oscillospiraceae bacterium]|nr:DAK2 domain-containing protein [Oscillospiraceae bacterium]
MTEILDSRLFCGMVINAAAAVESRSQEINELNVFPVPDGDTGTNMSMTLNNASRELGKGAPPTLGAAAEVTASAMLRGARGNSGVILSLLFRGMSKALKEKQTATCAELAAAMNEGVSAAYKAVMKPTEGTILTVSRLASSAAAEAAADTADMELMLEKAISAGDAALAETIEQNPVLKKAGVVDAGGMGYLIILRAFLSAARGQIIEPMKPQPAVGRREESVFARFDTEEDIHFPYCTEFIVQKDNEKTVDILRDFLASIGDSAVVLDDEELIKVHVHTDRPGDVLTEALTYGSLLTVKVENMREQHTSKLQEVEAAGAASAPKKPEPEKRPPTQPLSIVSVCAGEGLTALFHELGADQVVTGGQTMNPSTEDILRAVERSAGAAVIVLPNNKNIVMAAQQCAGLTEKQVIVIPTASIPQGISAILAADLELSPEANEADMLEAIQRVSSISVTYAARNSSFDGLEIRAGQYLALLEGKLLCCTDSLEELAEKIAGAAAQAELVSVFYGQDVSRDQAEAFSSSLGGKLPEAELSLVDGGQPVYYYLISAE